MLHSTFTALLQTTPLAHKLFALTQLLWPVICQLGELIEQFHTQDPTPTATFELEQRLAGLLRELGRLILHWTFNHLESDQPHDLPDHVLFAGQTYRRRRRHPNKIATLFGIVVLQRYLYEPLDPGESALHPLEIRLGIEAGLATPALAERVGCLAAQHSQRAVRSILRHDHGVSWSHTTIRTVAAALRGGMASHREPVQVGKLLEWLEQAHQSRGRHRPVLVAGRDGVHLPIRHRGYQEGAVATLAVYNRRGKRLGTLYLGRMPEPGQATLSDQMTRLITAVFQLWQGPLPRLAYVTDDGHHPKEYFRRVLKRMPHPRCPGHRLEWERIIDYYHACERISALASALFGPGKKGETWARRMRKMLKEQPRGAVRLLHSAAALRSKRALSRGELEAFRKAYGYLRRRLAWLRYAEYRQRGLPIGSGVTEAACKTVFSQRLKQSGMSWEVEGGQVIVDLRTTLLSGVWDEVYESYLESKDLPLDRTQHGSDRKEPRKSA